MSTADAGMHELYVLCYLFLPDACHSHLFDHNPEKTFLCLNP